MTKNANNDIIGSGKCPEIAWFQSRIQETHQPAQWRKRGKAMKKFLFGLTVVIIALLAVPAVGQSQVFLGSDGSVWFADPLVEYTSTGLSVTPEAMEYPEAIKQLIVEDRDFVPVLTKTTAMRMVGFWTWEEVTETELVLAKSGDLLVFRPPNDGAEKMMVEKEVSNPFGLLVAIFFGSLLMGNVLAGRKHSYATIAFTFAAIAIAFASAIAAAAAFAIADTFALVAATTAVIAATTAIAAASVLATTAIAGDTLWYRISSAGAATLMIVAVVAAIL